MIGDTVDKLEQRIRGLTTVSEDRRAELVALFLKLKAEIGALPAAQADRGETITRFAELSAHEAIRAAGSPELRSLSIQGLSTSVEGFEVSHPRLVQVVNSLCTGLANLGI
jgi:hypothetical protein